MKILLGYSWFVNNFCVKTHWENWLARLRDLGFDVHGYCLTLNPPGPCLTWKDLDSKWKGRDRTLLDKYTDLLTTIQDQHYDVFINYNGINLHPDFVKTMPTFNVFCCFDDPENSYNLSTPVAHAYDLCMVGNIACVDDYLSWGAKDAQFWPIGFRVNEYNPTLTKEQILSGERKTDVTLLCERVSNWRSARLNEFVANFPQARCHGYGWPTGYLDEAQKVALYQDTKIGPNFHNSSGPINFRTYTLPANGILEICDNKSNLGKIYKLNEEVVGFDTMAECVDACRYYLAHDEERRKIAAAGWERTMKDYTEKALFEKMINAIRASKVKTVR